MGNLSIYNTKTLLEVAREIVETGSVTYADPVENILEGIFSTKKVKISLVASARLASGGVKSTVSLRLSVDNVSIYTDSYGAESEKEIGDFVEIHKLINKAYLAPDKRRLHIAEWFEACFTEDPEVAKS